LLDGDAGHGSPEVLRRAGGPAEESSRVAGHGDPTYRRFISGHLAARGCAGIRGDVGARSRRLVCNGIAACSRFVCGDLAARS
jgi:hypothetical protein